MTEEQAAPETPAVTVTNGGFNVLTPTADPPATVTMEATPTVTSAPPEAAPATDTSVDLSNLNPPAPEPVAPPAIVYPEPKIGQIVIWHGSNGDRPAIVVEATSPSFPSGVSTLFIMGSVGEQSAFSRYAEQGTEPGMFTA